MEAKREVERLKRKMAGLREKLKRQSKLKKKLQNEIGYWEEQARDAEEQFQSSGGFSER